MELYLLMVWGLMIFSFLLLGLKSMKFFWFILYFEGVLLLVVGLLGMKGCWSGVILIFLSKFCMEAVVSICLLTYYSSFKSKSLSPIFF